MIRKGILSLLLVFGFLLGISDGYIALWKDEDPVPQVFPYRADRLPKQKTGSVWSGESGLRKAPSWNG